MHEDEIPVGRAENLIGKIFGRLTALYRVKNIGKNTAWMCQCSCGTKKIIAAKHLTTNAILMPRPDLIFI